MVLANGNRLRRAVEGKPLLLAVKEGVPLGRTFILGASSSTVTNEKLVKAGADTSLLKSSVPEMAAEIRRRL